MKSGLNINLLVRDFRRVAQIAGTEFRVSDVEVEFLEAPHSPPSRIPAGKMAVYVFAYGDSVLRVGKVGPRSQARYTSQHYNPGSAPSTLAATLLKHGDAIGVTDLDADTVGGWIKSNTDRLNFLLDIDCGVTVLALMESFLQCRLKPQFEGFSSQKSLAKKSANGET